MTRINIDRVWKQHLCTECGACLGVCPKSNIRIDRAGDKDYVFRVVDLQQCASCGLCAKVCPGTDVNFGALQDALFPGQKPDPWFGVFKQAYMARSNDPDAIRRGASGGVVTTLLEFGLKTGQIDGALVVGMNESVPWEPRPFVARSPEELHSATQSKYCPAPSCISFREVMSQEGRYAIVGLPCHIHALRKAQSILPKLRDRIVLTIGLFCGLGPTFLMIEHLLRRRGVDLDDVKMLRYRDKRAHNNVWPGGILVETTDGREVKIPLGKWLYASSLFMRRRCAVCPDYGAEFADVCLGDSHLKEYWPDGQYLASNAEPKPYTAPSGRVLHGPDAWNALIVRTATGESWINAALDGGEIDVEPIPIEKLKEGHANYTKKEEFWARLKFRRIMARRLPIFPGLGRTARLSLGQYVKPLVTTICVELVRNRFIRWILARLPERWLLKKIGIRQRFLKRAVETQIQNPNT